MKAVTAIAVLSLLLLYVWERVDIVRVGYQVERLKSKKVLALREGDELRVKVSTLTAPERIARAATEKLGMGPPHQGQVILVRVDAPTPSETGASASEIRLAKSDVAGRMP